MEINFGETYDDIMAFQILGNVQGKLDDTSCNYAFYLQFNEEAPIRYYISDTRDNNGTTSIYNYACTDGSSSVYVGDIKTTDGHFFDFRATGAINTAWWHFDSVLNAATPEVGTYETHHTFGQFQDIRSIWSIGIINDGRWLLSGNLTFIGYRYME